MFHPVRGDAVQTVLEEGCKADAGETFIRASASIQDALENSLFYNSELTEANVLPNIACVLACRHIARHTNYLHQHYRESDLCNDAHETAGTGNMYAREFSFYWQRYIICCLPRGYLGAPVASVGLGTPGAP